MSNDSSVSCDNFSCKFPSHSKTHLLNKNYGILKSNYLFNLKQGILGTVFLGEYVGFIGIIGMIFIQIGVLIISNEKEKVD